MSEEVSRLERLRWLRDRLVERIAADDCCVCERPAVSQLAPLAARLADVLERIDVVEKSQPRGSKVDELKDRRKSRRAGAAGRGGARRSGGDVGS